MWVSGVLVSGFWHAGFLLASQVLLLSSTSFTPQLHTDTFSLSRPGKSQISTENAVQTTKSWVGLRNEVQVSGGLGAYSARTPACGVQQ